MIFKRRGDDDSPIGPESDKPKRLLFCMDVSGSMYRFNGQDGRLERLLECTMMVMEALDGFSNKFTYSLVGHSGDGPDIMFVPFGAPPQNRKERLQVHARPDPRPENRAQSHTYTQVLLLT